MGNGVTSSGLEICEPNEEGHLVVNSFQMTIGWGCHPVLIFNKNNTPDEPIRFSNTQIRENTPSPSTASQTPNQLL